MSEDEYDDELPPISVHSVSRDSSEWVMPSACDVATQREREAATERELQLLRSADEEPVSASGGVAQVLHSDSSGSEGEVALTAAVTALRVAPSVPNTKTSTTDKRTPAIAFLATLLRHWPYPTPASADALLARYRDVLLARPSVAKAVTDHLVRRTFSVAAGEWRERELVALVGTLLAAVLARAQGPSGSARRALHQILDAQATESTCITACTRLLTNALDSESLVLRAADALRSGARASADTLAVTLAAQALARLLPPAPVDSPQSLNHEESTDTCVSEILERGGNAWRTLPAAKRYYILQLLGRALAAGASDVTRAANSRALQALHTLAAAAPATQRHAPDHLKVVVGAATLQLLFRAEQQA